MNLSVGMYVRTKHNGIGKIVEYINDATHYFFKCYKLDRDCSNCEEYITKADVIEEPSYNIIDLVRENDFVNGEKVSSIQYDGMGFEHIKCVQTICKFDDLDNRFYTETYFNKDIKSIVTKEQFLQMEYKVGD